MLCATSVAWSRDFIWKITSHISSHPHMLHCCSQSYDYVWAIIYIHTVMWCVLCLTSQDCVLGNHSVYLYETCVCVVVLCCCLCAWIAHVIFASCVSCLQLTDVVTHPWNVTMLKSCLLCSNCACCHSVCVTSLYTYCVVMCVSLWWCHIRILLPNQLNFRNIAVLLCVDAI